MTVITNYKEQRLNLYYCGSQRLAHNIQTKLNICPIDRFTTKEEIVDGKLKKGKIINVFVLVPELRQYLEEWSANRPTKKQEVNSG